MTPKPPRWLVRNVEAIAGPPVDVNGALAAAHDTDAEREGFVPARLSGAQLLSTVTGALAAAHDTDAEREGFIPARLSDTGLRASLARPGVYVPADWGQFWRPKRDAARAGAPAVVAVVADSIGHGYYSSDLTTKGFLGGLMRAQLQAAYGDGGSGFWGMKDSTIGLPTVSGYDGVDPAWWALTGTWTDPGTKAGPAGHTIASNTIGSTATHGFRGTTLDIFYLQANATSFTYAIDGGAPVTVNVATAAGTARTTITGLSAGQHTVTITVTTAAYLYLSGICGRNASGVRVDMFGQAGQSAAIFADTGGAGNYGAPRLYAGGPSNPSPADLLIYGMGANDVSGNVTGDAFAASVATLVNGIKNNATMLGATDVLFYLPILNVGTWGGGRYLLQDYSLRLRGLAQMYGAAFVDLNAFYRGSWAYADSLGLMSTGNGRTGAAGHDPAHPGDAGHADYWAKLSAAVPQLAA
jgi:hypothetical protein